MRFRTWWSKSPLSISEAFIATVDDDRDGIAERAMAQGDKTAEALGKLLEKLHAKGVLEGSDIRDFIHMEVAGE